MKLEVGKFYLNASGEIIKIIGKKSKYFISTYDNEYDTDGSYLYEPHPNDLIAEIPTSLHQYLIQTIKDYYTDLDFKDTVDSVKDENIDLRNTWCINTEENYNELIKNGVKTNFKFNKEYKYLSVNSHLDMWATKKYMEIKKYNHVSFYDCEGIG